MNDKIFSPNPKDLIKVIDNLYSSMNNYNIEVINLISNLEFKSIEDVVSDLSKYSDTITFVGDGAVAHKDYIMQNLHSCNFSETNDLSSFSLGLAGLASYKEGINSSIMPLYLRKSQAERALEEKGGKK